MLVFYLRVGVVVVSVNFFFFILFSFLSFLLFRVSYSLLSRLLQVDFFCFVPFSSFPFVLSPGVNSGPGEGNQTLIHCYELISEADFFFYVHLICLLFDGSSSGSLTFLRDRGERQPAPLLIRLRTLNAPD